MLQYNKKGSLICVGFLHPDAFFLINALKKRVSPDGSITATV